MSRPHYYWYEIVKKMCKKYPEIAAKTDKMADEEKRYVDAINATLDEFDSHESGKEQVAAVKMVLFDKTHTPIGAGNKLGYSRRVIDGWISLFIKSVGKKVGYNCITKPEKGGKM
jgi:hypothetical protein